MPDQVLKRTMFNELNNFYVGHISMSTMNQPAQSPKVNINDIDFFHSLSHSVEKYINQNIQVL